MIAAGLANGFDTADMGLVFIHNASNEMKFSPALFLMPAFREYARRIAGAPGILASIARELGILTVAVVTKPFQYEGHRRMSHAEEGIRDLGRHVDTLLIIPNQRLLGIVDKATPLLDAFKVADDVLRQAIQGLSLIHI